jgi:hypothetical protein
MKMKETFDSKNACTEKVNSKTRQKSLRPMRSMVSLRSFKPKTAVVSFSPKSDSPQ